MQATNEYEHQVSDRQVDPAIESLSRNLEQLQVSFNSADKDFFEFSLQVGDRLRTLEESVTEQAEIIRSLQEMVDAIEGVPAPESIYRPATLSDQFLVGIRAIALMVGAASLSTFLVYLGVASTSSSSVQSDRYAAEATEYGMGAALSLAVIVGSELALRNRDR
jgi:hypothetical protein